MKCLLKSSSVTNEKDWSQFTDEDFEQIQILELVFLTFLHFIYYESNEYSFLFLLPMKMFCLGLITCCCVQRYS